MTEREAFERDLLRRFREAVNAAIYESEAVRLAWADLRAMGLDCPYLEIRAAFQKQSIASANSDQDFLRKLRITPDLEVRE